LALLLFVLFFFMSGDEIVPSYCYNSDSLRIEWDKPENVEAVKIYVITPENGKEEVGTFDGKEAVISNVLLGKPLEIKYEMIPSSKLFGFLDFSVFHTTFSETVNPVEIIPPELTVDINSVSSNTEQYGFKIKWPIEGEGETSLYMLNGEEKVRLESDHLGRENFTVGEDVDMPGISNPIIIIARTTKEIDGIVYNSTFSKPVEIKRADFMPKDILLELKQDEDGKYLFTFNEAQNDTYELKMQNGFTHEFETVETYEVDESLKQNTFTYSLDWLPSGSEMTYKVVAYDKDDPDNISESNVMEVVGETSSVYCTIWPIANLKVYDTSTSTTRIDNVVEGECYSVIEEADGRFKIRLGNGNYGYIDTRYCMINLPDFIGNMCLYDITNSYASLYNVNGLNIEGLTSQKIKGYENMDIEEGRTQFVVPCLYPTACKLLEAAKSAISDDYILKICDAFRPTEAYGFINEALSKHYEQFGEEMNYSDPVTGLSYGMEDYAPRSGTHDMGIALDVMLVNQNTGEEIKMQTSIYDLSKYSFSNLNNENANILKTYMIDAGFTNTYTNWWEFSDSQIRNDISLQSKIETGLSIEGFKKNRYGWKYQKADGNFVTDTSINIEGVEYRFDELGYCMEDM